MFLYLTGTDPADDPPVMSGGFDLEGEARAAGIFLLRPADLFHLLDEHDRRGGRIGLGDLQRASDVPGTTTQ